MLNLCIPTDKYCRTARQSRVSKAELLGEAVAVSMAAMVDAVATAEVATVAAWAVAVVDMACLLAGVSSMSPTYDDLPDLSRLYANNVF